MYPSASSPLRCLCYDVLVEDFLSFLLFFFSLFVFFSSDFLILLLIQSIEMFFCLLICLFCFSKLMVFIFSSIILKNFRIWRIFSNPVASANFELTNFRLAFLELAFFLIDMVSFL